MSYEFLAKNGLISQGNVTVTGSLTTSQGDIIVNYNSTSSNSVFRTFATSHAAGNRNASLAFGLYDGALTAMTVVNTASSNPSFNSQYISFATHEGGINVGERMRITPLGNVGIGTINPTATLQIVGSVLATSFTGSLSGSITNALTSSYLTPTNNYTITNLTASNISASGTSSFSYVGIGTTNPGSRLTVSGSIESLIDNGGEGGQLILRGNTYRYNIDNFYGQALRFFREDDTTASNGVVYMVISASGNVGIGTTFPNSKLEVAGTAGTGVVSITNTTNGRSGSFGIDSNGVYLQNSNNGDYFDLKNASGTARFRLIYDNNTYINTTYTSVGSLTASGSKLSVFGNLSVGSTYGAITASSNGAIFEGDVGIGTTTPTAQSNYRFLQVNGTNSAVIETMVGGTRIGGFDSTSNTLYVGSIGSFPVVFRTAVDEKMRITAAGLVGIGTSSPSQKLEVQSGSVLIRGDGTALFGTYYASAGENTFFTLHSGSGNTFHIGNDVAGTNYNTMVFTAATDTTGGKVGIGTSSPGSKLQINDNTPVLTIRTNDGGTSRKAYIDFYTTFFNFPSDVGARRTSTIVTGFDSGVWGTEFLAFNVGSGSSNDAALLPIERVRIDGSGNLGVGTSTIIGKLQVNSTSAPYYGPATSSATANGIFILGNTTADVVNTFGVDASATAYAWIQPRKTGTATYYSLALNPNGGNVGIGTTAPAYLLDVSGSSRHGYRTADNHYFTGSVNISGSLNATASWANNVVSASYATTAQTANALNASNTYTIAGLTSAYVDVNGSATIPSTGIYRPSSKTLGLSADATLILKINGSVSPYVTSIESGNVGIGSSSPTSKFEVLTSAVALANQPNIIGNFRGDTDGRSLIRVDNTSTSAGAAALQAGISFVAYSNVSSQPSANKHEAQIILGSTGATSVTGGQTGTLQIIAPQDIAFNVSASNIIMTGSSYTTFGYNAMYITRAGNIGIGTTNPSSRLHISGSSSTTITITDDALYTNSISNDNSVMTYTVDTGNAAAASADHVFKRYTTELVRINASGNVGIGTTSPATKLHVYSAGGGFEFGVGSSNCYIETIDRANTATAINTNYYTRGTGSFTWNNGSYTERMRIDGSGNVGIGTTTPVFQTEILGSNQTTANITDAGNKGGMLVVRDSGAAANNGGVLGFSTAIASGSYIQAAIKSLLQDGNGYGRSHLAISLRSAIGDTSLTEKMRINSDGNVGIGTTSPVATLQVAGNVSGSSFTSSISNAVGFLGTSSWAQTANALNTSNTYTIAGLTSAYVDVNGSGTIPTTGIYRPSTKTLGLSADSTLIFKISNVSSPATSSIETGNFIVQTGNVGIGTSSPVAKLQVSGSISGSSFTSSISNAVGFLGTSSWAQTANALNTANSYTVGSLTSTTQVGSTSGTLLSYVTPGIYANGASTGNAIGIISNTTFANQGAWANIGLHQTGSNVNDINAGVYLSIGGWYQNSGTGLPVYIGGGYTSNSSSILSVVPTNTAGSGNVGIGTTSPGAFLELSSSTAASLFNIKGARGNNIIYVSGSGNIGINSSAFDPLAPEALLISGSTYNIISADTNINTYGQIHTQNRSAGTSASSDLVATNDTGTELGNYVDLGINSSGYTAGFIGNANDAYLYNTGSQFFIGNASPGRNLYFFAGSTTNSASMMLSASGNVGIGTTNATDKFTVYGALASYKTGADTIQTQVYLANTGNTRAFNLQLNSGGTGLDLWSYNSSNAWLRHTTFDYNGSVGIGTATAILGKLQLDSGVAPYYGPATSSATPNGFLTLGSTSSDVVNTFGVDATSTAYAWIQPRKASAATYYSLVLNPNGGNVGIGTVTPAAKLEITGSSNSALLNIKSPISGAILYVSGSGAVGIGTSNVGAFTLQVSGSFGATTKSFIIDHPTKAGKKLMYGSLESPYHGIRLTGRDTLKEGKCKIQLPDYIYKLILHDSVNIQLTGIKCNKTLYIDDINIPENYFTIAYDKESFEIYKDYDFFWDFTAIRADVPELQTEM